MNNRGYYVLKQCRKWEYVPELGQSVWVETSAEQVTPYRQPNRKLSRITQNWGFLYALPHSYNAMIILY